MLASIVAWFVAAHESLREKWSDLIADADAYNRAHNKSDIHIVATLKNDVKIIVIGIVFVAVGVLLVSELDSALPTISNTGLSSDYETSLGHFGTGITLIGVALIIVPAISILRRMDVI